MIHVVECFAWCMVQVTLFTAAAAGVYWLVGRQRANRNVRLLTMCFGVIAVLTFASVSPWPQWKWDRLGSDAASTADSPLRFVAPPNPDLKLLVGPTAEVPTSNIPKSDVLVLHPMSALSQDSHALDDVGESTRPWWYFAVWAAWIAIAVGVMRFVIALAFVRRYRRDSRSIEEAGPQAEFETLRAQLGAPACVALRESPSLAVAATIGWRRPLVLLPATWRDWTPDERRAVLAHELAHVTERHFPVWVASQLATVAHFYHPLVHWLGRRLRLEQELAADQLAARTFGNRRQYAAVLAGLALDTPRFAPGFAGLGLFMSRPLLMRRIAMLREPNKSRQRPSSVVRATALVMLAAATIAAVGIRSSTVASATDESATGSNGMMFVEVDLAPGAIVSGVVQKNSGPTPSPPSADLTAMLDGLPAIDVPADSEDLRPAAAPPNATKQAPPVEDVPDNEQTATALIQISSDMPSLIGPSPNGQSWKVFSRTQAALLGSKFVLQAALRDPDVAKLPLVTAQQDPVEWMYSHVEIGFIPDSEIMYVRLRGGPNEQEQLRKLVDGVVRAYMSEIVHVERQRQLTIRDALAKSFQRLSDEITNKMERYNALAKDLGVSTGSRDPISELQLHEITDLMHSKRELERNLADLRADFEIVEQRIKNENQGEDDLAPFRDSFEIKTRILTERLSSVSKAIEEKTEAFARRGEESVELEVQQAELGQLQSIASEISIKLEMIDIEAVQPDRVRVIQWAM